MDTIDSYYGTLELLDKWDKRYDKNNFELKVVSVNIYKNTKTYTLIDNYGNIQDASATDVCKLHKNGYRIDGVMAIRSDGTIHISKSVPRMTVKTNGKRKGVHKKR